MLITFALNAEKNKELPHDYEQMIIDRSDLFINGNDIECFKVALDEFEKLGWERTDYLISGTRKEGLIEITFMNKWALKKGILGRSKKYPGITYVVKIGTAQIIRHFYSR